MDNSTREKASPLGVVAVEADVDVARFDAMLNAGHYLGARQPSGHTLRQAVVDGDGAWVAVALWCGGTYRLDPRDGHIGWDARKREERGALVTQLARFMVDGRRRGPNVASQALGAALRALPAQFRAKYGYAPALAESFSDPELHAGTLYLATNWTKLGLSKGFSRDYADYYVPNARPKALWVRPLRDDWRASLCATALPDGDAQPCAPRGNCRWTTRAWSRFSARSWGCATGAGATAASRRSPCCARSPSPCSAATAASPSSSASPRA